MQLGLRSLWTAASRLERATLVGLTAAGAGLRALGIANTVPTAVINMPLPDDAFYYLHLARNLGTGAGWTVSADSTATVGFQPLWGFMLAGIEALFHPSDFTRVTAAQALGATIGMATALLLAGWIFRLVRRVDLSLLALASVALSPQIIKHHLNGMETSLAMLLAVALLQAFLSSPEDQPPPPWLLGIVTGVAILARVDLILLAAPLAFVHIAAVWRGRGPAAGAATAIGMTLGALVIAGPWLVHSWRIGGSPVPESGAAVRNLTLLVRNQPFLSLAQSIRSPGPLAGFYFEQSLEFTSAWIRQVPLLFPVSLPLFAALGVDAAVPLSALLALPIIMLVVFDLNQSPSWQAPLRAAILSTFGFMTLGYAVVILGPWFYQRYTAALGMIANCLLLLAVARLLARASARWFQGIAVVSMFAGFLALATVGSYRWLIAGPAAVPDDGYYRAATSLEANVPESAPVGVFSAGLIGYYGQRPVIPLDGKVHAGARAALAEGRMLSFLCEHGVGYVLDWEEMARNLIERRSQSWTADALLPVSTVEVASYNDLVLYRIEPEACGTQP